MIQGRWKTTTTRSSSRLRKPSRSRKTSESFRAGRAEVYYLEPDEKLKKNKNAHFKACYASHRKK